MTSTYPYRQRTIITEKSIASMVRFLALELDAIYRSLCPHLIGVLTTSYIFLADLSRAMNIGHTVGFATVCSRKNQTHVWLHDPDPQERKRGLVLVDTIVETGGTLQQLARYVARCSPCSGITCTVSLLARDDPPKIVLPNHIHAHVLTDPAPLVGYGLDNHGKNPVCRSLPSIVEAPQSEIRPKS